MNRNDLRLHEEVMLLALKDEEGTTASGTWYSHAISASLVAELLLAERIEVEDSKKRLVHCRSHQSLGDPLLDECLTLIRESSKPRNLPHWIAKFSGLKELKHRVAHQLVDRGILRADEDKVLLIFTRRIYPERDPAPEERIVARLRDAIFSETREVDPRTTVLVALTHSTGILRVVFDKKELKERKQRIDDIVKGSLVGKATQQVIQAVQTAVLVSTIAATTIATTSAGR